MAHASLDGSLLVPVRRRPLPAIRAYTRPLSAAHIQVQLIRDTAHVIELIPHQILTKHRIEPVVTQDDGSLPA